MGEDTTITTHFSFATRALLDSLTSKREGEVKLGEQLQIVVPAQWQEALEHSTAKYVVLGIPEDIGVRANGGVGGAETLWDPFLKAFANLQHTSELRGTDIILLGAFDFKQWVQDSIGNDTTALRQTVGQLDEVIYPVIAAIVKAGKIPVVIGGGHNNCYPLIKGAAKALGVPVNSINLDAHSDYRMPEGRHSGNGFRYAKEEGYLSKYAMVGLHKNYNSQAVMDVINDNADLHYTFYEDIYLDGLLSFKDAVLQAVTHTKNKATGIELDLDCIENILSSAMTPSGIAVQQARQYIHWCAANAQAVYLHITEGAVELHDGRWDGSTGKLAAYLVSDFIRSGTAAHQLS